MLQGNYTSDTAQFFINLVTFWILYSYLVPISLFVTMEIVKFWQVGVGGGPRCAADKQCCQRAACMLLTAC